MVRPARTSSRAHSIEPKLVAMVSVYNSGKWIRDRIDNLLETDIYRRGELLIYCANAASPDPVDNEVCISYLDRSNFVYERTEFMSVYATWNRVIRATSTPFITNANTDDLVAPEAYDVLLSALRDNDFAYCGWYTIGDGVRKWSDIPAGANGNDVSHYCPPHDQLSCGHFPVWRRSVHDRIGLFDPKFKAAGDADYWIRAWRNGITGFAPVGAYLGAYRWRVGSPDGGNLWHRIDDTQRTEEWATIHSRQAGKFEF